MVMISQGRVPGGVLRLAVLLAAAGMGLSGCNRNKAAEPGETRTSMTLPNLAEASPLPPDIGPMPAIDGARALQYAREIAAFGPRPIGSENHRKLEDYIYAHLRGDQVEDDYFMANTTARKPCGSGAVMTIPTGRGTWPRSGKRTER